jgi:hypothetical protein
MLEKPALYKCGAVGMGCTSIARRVFENWEPGLPFFRNEYKDQGEGKEGEDNWKFAHGEVSHDVWFCQQATRQGFEIYLDSSLHCNHLTEGHTDARHFMMHNQKELESKIWTPNREQRRKKAKA